MDTNNLLTPSGSPNPHQHGSVITTSNAAQAKVLPTIHISDKSPIDEKIRPSLEPLTTFPIFNLGKDLDRESLGILPNISKELDAEFLSIRESISFRKQSLSVGLSSSLPRESLGILNISSMDVERESLKIMNVSSLIGKESLTPRESLGVMNMTNLVTQAFDIKSDLSFCSPSGAKRNVSIVPELLLDLEEDKLATSTNQLNVGFLITENSRKGSAVSCASSVSPTFNSRSLDEPSKIINSKTSISPDDKDLFNCALQGTDNFRFSSDSKLSLSSIHSSNSNLSNNANDIKKCRARIQSMPVMLEEKSFEVVTRNHSYSGAKNDDFKDGCNVSQEFGDSVFIEANQMAEKLADGSIYEETSGKEMDVLDLTPQPDWPCVSDIEKFDENPKADTECVFKTVDKMLPSSAPTEIKTKTSNKNDSISLDDNPNTSNKSTNKSNLSNNNLSRISQVSHKSEKNASKLLKNLSDMLKENDVLSKSQKSEGQSLLHSLADILRDTGSKDLSSEDSGHSSIAEHDNEEGDKEGLLDPAKNEGGQETKSNRSGVKSSNHRGSLNIPVPNRGSLSRSLASPSRRTIPGIIIKTPNSSVEVNKSTASNASTSSAQTSGSRNASGSSIGKPPVAGKLRPPKVTTSIIANKKGPLKAVLPVAEMKRLPNTPTKSEQDAHHMVQSKRTSTPFHEPKLKPVAASTPTSRIQRPSKEYFTSASTKAKSNSFTYKKATETSNYSPTSTEQPKRPLNKSLTNAKMESSKLQRRNSASEVRSSTITGSENPKLKRSNSVGKEPKIMTALSKVRQNILNSPYFDGKRASLTGLPSENNNTIELLSENNRNVNQNKSVTREIRPPSMISKLRKPGKENMAA